MKITVKIHENPVTVYDRTDLFPHPPPPHQQQQLLPHTKKNRLISFSIKNKRMKSVTNIKYIKSNNETITLITKCNENLSLPINVFYRF